MSINVYHIVILTITSLTGQLFLKIVSQSKVKVLYIYTV